MKIDFYFPHAASADSGIAASKQKQATTTVIMYWGNMNYHVWLMCTYYIDPYIRFLYILLCGIILISIHIYYIYEDEFLPFV